MRHLEPEWERTYNEYVRSLPIHRNSPAVVIGRAKQFLSRRDYKLPRFGEIARLLVIVLFGGHAAVAFLPFDLPQTDNGKDSGNDDKRNDHDRFRCMAHRRTSAMPAEHSGDRLMSCDRSGVNRGGSRSLYLARVFPRTLGGWPRN